MQKPAQYMEKFRTIVNFHLAHYTDPKKDMSPEHIIVAAMLLEGKIRLYAEYAHVCSVKDIAGVTEKTWNEAQ